MQSLPKIANPHRFIASGETVSGTVPIAELTRLADRLPEDLGADAVPPLSWSVRGLRDPMGRPGLEITVDGSFPLACQRCLSRLDWPLAQKTPVLIARTEAEMAELDESSDWEVVLCGDGIDVLALVEDELLLSLPFSPLHEENNPSCDAKWSANRG